ncbi:MAG TPA: 50S ribosomal protein L11 methyltransferase [Bryobacteraceae bacterium]|nr:50S ribosomal protein L11 methyltransferase [Bryobacteraceae bacterium]
MRSILFRCPPAEADHLIAEIWEQGSAGILEEPEGLRAFFASGVDIEELVARYHDMVVDRRDEPAADWAQMSRENWDPVLLGERFFVAPPWLSDAPTPAGRIRLVMDCRRAFGTGRHESTQLCVEALERYVTSGDSVADIGCGSGILSRVARELGAGPIVSCDLDPVAVQETQEIAGTAAFVGSANAIRSEWADIVVANISAAAIDAMFDDLRRIARPGATLILAGFLTGNPPRRFSPDHIICKYDWSCWILAHQPGVTYG